MRGRSTEVTVWYRKTKKGLEFNHYEEGWRFGSRPTPINEEQEKKWKGIEWHRAWGYNVDGKIQEIIKEEK